ncbi:hypothetical protein GCM10027194_07350 [Thalassiella azotivora]
MCSHDGRSREDCALRADPTSGRLVCVAHQQLVPTPRDNPDVTVAVIAQRADPAEEVLHGRRS